MKATKLNIPDVILLEPTLYRDNRGVFFESFNQKTFLELTQSDVVFVQDNQSLSRAGVLRGLHYQLPPKAQGKLVRVINGEIFDVAVDIRKNSPTFGQWVGEILSAENKRLLWIPPGFAHGFLTLGKPAEILYKVTEYYSPSCDRTIIWNDQDINIQWPLNVEPILSSKDAHACTMKNSEVFN